jgi:hypothetical protein
MPTPPCLARGECRPSLGLAAHGLARRARPLKGRIKRTRATTELPAVRVRSRAQLPGAVPGGPPCGALSSPPSLGCERACGPACRVPCYARHARAGQWAERLATTRGVRRGVRHGVRHAHRHSKQIRILSSCTVHHASSSRQYNLAPPPSIQLLLPSSSALRPAAHSIQLFMPGLHVKSAPLHSIQFLLLSRFHVKSVSTCFPLCRSTHPAGLPLLPALFDPLLGRTCRPSIESPRLMRPVFSPSLPPPAMSHRASHARRARRMARAMRRLACRQAMPHAWPATKRPAHATRATYAPCASPMRHAAPQPTCPTQPIRG